MTARVNLLPQASRERSQQAAQRVVAVLALAVVVAVLGGLYWWKVTEVRDAEERLAAAEQTTAELRAEEAELEEFAALERRLQEADEVVAAAMAGEVSIAGFLQDLAMVMPNDAQLDTLSFTVEPLDEDDDLNVATFTATGQSLRSHAPGVERLLLELEKVANFHDIFLTTSILQDIEDIPGDDDITTYSLQGRLNAGAQTGRYAEGLPEEMR